MIRISQLVVIGFPSEYLRLPYEYFITTSPKWIFLVFEYIYLFNKSRVISFSGIE